jgi:hypothetical protein
MKMFRIIIEIDISSILMETKPYLVHILEKDLFRN